MIRGDRDAGNEKRLFWCGERSLVQEGLLGAASNT